MVRTRHAAGAAWKERAMRKALLAVVAVVLTACLSLFAVETQTRLLQRLYTNHILDNREHFLPCDRLPAASEASRIVESHQDAVGRIEEVNPGLVEVAVDTWTCPGKADIVISYPSHRDRVAIERIIDGDTFFGVPYRLYDR
jgi:hypothetical protein